MSIGAKILKHISLLKARYNFFIISVNISVLVRYGKKRNMIL